MYLKRLELINFRNYGRLVLEPHLFFNMLAGQNAQGKTNLLEAVFMGSTGRSFRTSREKELIRWGCDFSAVSCFFETEQREYEVKINLLPGQKKILLNGTPAKNYPLGWPGVILFSPDDLVLVKGAPSERRRFLDHEMGSFNPQYEYYLQRFQRVLMQRNNLLREIREKRQRGDVLEAWDEQFCAYGAKLLSFRLDILKKLIPVIFRFHKEIAGSSESIEVRYNSSVRMEKRSDEKDIFKQIAAGLAALRKEETERAQSLLGPHRDDISFFINGADARFYGSQGQQRTVVLSIKLAQIEQWKNETGEYPVLLLDDVLFELDRERQKALLSNTAGKVQTFVTSTSAEDFNIYAKAGGRVYNIRQGTI